MKQIKSPVTGELVNVIKFNVSCPKFDIEPFYRVYVNGDLIVERTFIWKDKHVTENIVILHQDSIKLDIESVCKIESEYVLSTVDFIVSDITVNESEAIRGVNNYLEIMK